MMHQILTRYICFYLNSISSNQINHTVIISLRMTAIISHGVWTFREEQFTVLHIPNPTVARKTWILMKKYVNEYIRICTDKMLENVWSYEKGLACSHYPMSSL